MSDRQSSMRATLADLKSKPATDPRLKAIANIESALAKMDSYAAAAPKGGGHGRAMTTYDREALMRIADDPERKDAARLRAKAILSGGPTLSKGDADFVNRSTGTDQ